MKKFLMTTALVAATAMPAAAEKYATTDIYMSAATDVNIMASDFVGSRVYVSEKEFDRTAANGVDAEWDDIGEIHDVVLSRDGNLDAILIDVGGFLGIGEKTIAARMDHLSFVSDGEGADEYFVVFKASKAELEAAPAFDVASLSQMTYGDATEVAKTDLTAEMLTGSPVYDANDKWIGEVSELILTSDGQVSKAVVDVGGFLGLGEKPVALELDAMTVNRDGDEIRVRVDATKKALEAMPTYNN